MRREKGNIHIWVIMTLLATLFIVASCGNQSIPKPYGYFRLDLPQKHYIKKDFQCPFTFEIPTYSRLELHHPDDPHPCWFNISFPRFHARVYMTYKQIHGNLGQLSEETYKMAFKNEVKATNISTHVFQNDSAHVYGIVYDLSGDVASNMQFYLTDSTQNFLRGSLYFDTRPNADSLAPVAKFIKADILHLAATLRWK